ncbi:hypothetical protein QR680_008183 [Steinernema hermaphroditum]|uniref:Uncharacterized protein n=1 Tax=Steinernema hermaphroditum TaxID=289476 RepID=A0AA39IFQ1_9BILA|nr:hypothetical protein QR680_008183 [Steinernema hermaphroditum]
MSDNSTTAPATTTVYGNTMVETQDPVENAQTVPFVVESYVPTMSMIWVTVVFYILIIGILMCCSGALVFTRWIYKRHARRRLDAEKEKHHRLEEKLRGDEPRIKEVQEPEKQRQMDEKLREDEFRFKAILEAEQEKQRRIEQRLREDELRMTIKLEAETDRRRRLEEKLREDELQMKDQMRQLRERELELRMSKQSVPCFSPTHCGHFYWAAGPTQEKAAYATPEGLHHSPTANVMPATNASGKSSRKTERPKSAKRVHRSKSRSTRKAEPYEPSESTIGIESPRKRTKKKTSSMVSRSTDQSALAAASRTESFSAAKPTSGTTTKRRSGKTTSTKPTSRKATSTKPSSEVITYTKPSSEGTAYTKPSSDVTTSTKPSSGITAALSNREKLAVRIGAVGGMLSRLASNGAVEDDRRPNKNVQLVPADSTDQSTLRNVSSIPTVYSSSALKPTSGVTTTSEQKRTDNSSSTGVMDDPQFNAVIYQIPPEDYPVISANPYWRSKSNRKMEIDRTKSPTTGKLRQITVKSKENTTWFPPTDYDRFNWKKKSSKDKAEYPMYATAHHKAPSTVPSSAVSTDNTKESTPAVNRRGSSSGTVSVELPQKHKATRINLL